MLSLPSIVRHRKTRKDQGRHLPILGIITVGIKTFGVFLFVTALFLAGLKYASLLEDLPPVGNIELLYNETVDGLLEPIHIYDRNGLELFDLVHPLATNRRWMKISGTGIDVLPREVVDAIITSQDESFWTNHGYNLEPLLFSILRGDWNIPEFQFPPTIARRLVAMTILPAEDFSGSAINRYVRETVLAQRLTQHYTKEQILEWYLNTLGFGPLTSGIDAASLVYFGKHSNKLSLAEGAFLAGLAQESDNKSVVDFKFQKDVQEQVLLAMVRNGLINEFQYRDAISETINVNTQIFFGKTTLQETVWEMLGDLLGPSFRHRANLQVFTSIDYPLQLQVGCSAFAYLNQLSEQSDDSGVLGVDKEECDSSTITQRIKHGNVAPEGAQFNLASLVLDPESGEILAYLGLANHTLPSGAMIYPFVYLTSFSKGSSPGSLVLDIPPVTGETLELDIFSGYQAKGPARMRTAILGGYPLAAQRTILSTGLEDVLRVIEQMGLANTQIDDPFGAKGETIEMLEASLINAAFGYGVLANEGTMVGMETTALQGDQGWQELGPILIKLIQEDSGKVLYEVFTDERPIVSKELAYLVTDVLRDGNERWSILGSENTLDLNFPIALMMDNAHHSSATWTIGYTPSRVVGVWLQGRSVDVEVGGEEAVNSLPLWAAMMQSASQDVIIQDWDVPEGIVWLDVCDPSGLLPTEHCPHVVTEIFLEGTEPVYYDPLYRPFKINKDTLNLATVFTPLDKIEEFVFILLPPEARNWAQGEGLMQPPLEYDSLRGDSNELKDIGIDDPKDFEYVSGLNWISGWMKVEDFSFFRLLYGHGLNPDHWFQIGEDQEDPVEGGTLALWDTRGLEGLYTLQLVVVEKDGIAQIATKYVTIDNLKPEVELIEPRVGDTFDLSQDEYISVAVSVFDNIGISRVELYSNGKRLQTISEEPYRIEIPIKESGMVEISVKVYDLAGNETESEVMHISVLE